MSIDDTETIAIRTGRFFTAVTIDSDANQCRVAVDGQGSISHLVVGGTGEASIKRAATDCSGRGYTTLRELMFDCPTAERRRDLDC